jgi:hypothetical protein
MFNLSSRRRDAVRLGTQSLPAAVTKDSHKTSCVINICRRCHADPGSCRGSFRVVVFTPGGRIVSKGRCSDGVCVKVSQAGLRELNLVPNAETQFFWKPLLKESAFMFCVPKKSCGWGFSSSEEHPTVPYACRRKAEQHTLKVPLQPASVWHSLEHACYQQACTWSFQRSRTGRPGRFRWCGHMAS